MTIKDLDIVGGRIKTMKRYVIRDVATDTYVKKLPYGRPSFDDLQHATVWKKLHHAKSAIQHGCLQGYVGRHFQIVRVYIGLGGIEFDTWSK